jgi:hypothetical protein
MSLTSGPNFVNNGLVFALDAANLKSFRGEPTTNLVRVESDYTGTAYAPENQWSDGTATTTIGKQYDPTIRTPLGFGATIITESSSFGWQTLTRFGGGGSGNFSLSAFVKPIDSDLVTMQIGLLAAHNTQLNLQTRQITYNSMPAGPRSGFIEDVLSHPGWLRVGSNLLGRSGGWVGSIGYSVSAYSGSNSKRMYITGLQYETTVSPTRYLLPQTTRGTTAASGGGWTNIAGAGGDGETINNPSYSSSGGGSLLFNGTNHSVSLPVTGPHKTQLPLTISCWINGNGTVISTDDFNCNQTGGQSSRYYGVILANNSTTITVDVGNGGGCGPSGRRSASSSFNYSEGWINIVVTIGSNLADNPILVYVNGQLLSSTYSGTGTSIQYTSNKQGTIGSRIEPVAFFNGRINSIYIYNKILSVEEIRQNFNSARGRFGI